LYIAMNCCKLLDLFLLRIPSQISTSTDQVFAIIEI
jgi:hypothetical protein